MSGTQVFCNFSLFDGKSPKIRPNCWLEVSGDQIRRIGTGTHPELGETVDLGGRTVIPGLIDPHVHLTSLFAPNLNHPAVVRSMNDQIRLNMLNCIRSGVTTVREVGAAPGMLKRLKSWVASGKVLGPRIVRCNSFIIPPGATPEAVEPVPLPVRIYFGGQVAERVRTPDEVRNAVRRMVELGADWIKTTHNDTAYFLGRPNPSVFDDACYRALVDEARKLNTPVAMHQNWASGFRKAVELGVDSMEHAPLDEVTDKDIERMVKARIPIIPTFRWLREPVTLDRIAVWLEEEGEKYVCPGVLQQLKAEIKLYQENKITEEMGAKGYYYNVPLFERYVPVLMENVRRMHEAGAVIGCGTDSGNRPFTVFGRYFEEIEHLVEIGFSPYEALQSATAVNARILKLDDKLGSVEPGKLADFVVLDGNPLEDTKALRKVRMVVKDGVIVHRQ